MFRIVRSSLFPLIVLGLTTLGNGQEPTVPNGGPPSGVNAAPVARGPAIAGANDVLATVTSHGHTDKITKGEVLNFLGRNALPPPDEREAAYHMVVDMLVNTALLNQFLVRQNIAVPSSKVDEQIDRVKEQLKRERQDLQTFLLQTGTTLEELRKVFENRVRWMEFYKLKGTDATLRKFLNDNRDRFSRTQVRASHIFLKVDADASPADKAKVKQRLLNIRNDIFQNKLTFAEAANKYSEDPANAGGAGGDLDWFQMDGGIIEEFATPAFKLRKGEISQPIETPEGMHLIQVTDRKEGKLPDFEQSRPYVLEAFATDLQNKVVTAERTTAKIDVKPMPKDLFPPDQPTTGAPIPKS